MLWVGPAALAVPVRADEGFWSLLKGGGQVVLMRHAVTTPGVGDPQGMVLHDCGTQRNLTDEGRAHARTVGEAFRAPSVPVGQVFPVPGAVAWKPRGWLLAGIPRSPPP